MDAQPNTGVGEFKPFSQLLMELQLEIWKFGVADSASCKIFVKIVETTFKNKELSTNFSYSNDAVETFKLCPREIGMLRACSTSGIDSGCNDMPHLALTRASTETRTVFLNMFQYDLPCGVQGKIRFSEGEMIYIDNFADTFFTDEVFAGIKDGYALQRH